MTRVRVTDRNGQERRYEFICASAAQLFLKTARDLAWTILEVAPPVAPGH